MTNCTSMAQERREKALKQNQIVASFMRDLVEWVLNETDLNPDKGVITSAKDYCEMHNVTYDCKTIEPLLFTALIGKGA